MSVQWSVHDFSGHPFQVELARRLADRGHDVTHTSSAEYVSGKGHLQHRPGDSQTLRFERLAVDRPFAKYSPVARVRWELAYGSATIAQLKRRGFGVWVACNIPLVANYRAARWSRRHGVPWVFWHQDVYSAGLSDELRSRFPRPLAAVGSWVFRRMEAYCARHAVHVVAIGDAFTAVYGDWGVAPTSVSIIPNWAPLADIVPMPREGSPAAELFPGEGLRLLYAGTLGRKHNPDLLIDLVRQLRDRGVPVQLTVASEGEAADHLAAVAHQEPDLGLRVVGFRDAEEFPAALGTADVLVALLEPEATRFSIPSKVLSYMAAGRPILGLMPADNPAAVDIVGTGGHVGTPDAAGLAAAVDWVTALTADDIVSIGARARSVAEEKFDVETVTTRFEEILVRASS